VGEAASVLRWAGRAAGPARLAGLQAKAG
jgi:hypothetical protein